VLEFFEDAFHLAYVGSYNNRITRTRIPDGLTTTVATFSNLSDMCSFTVLPSRNRWYFHYEGSGQFGGSSETLGYADAQLLFNGPPVFSGLGIVRFAFEDLPVAPITFTVVDESTPGSNLLVSASSDNPEVVPSENLHISGSDSNFTLNVTLLPEAWGVANLTIRAEDADGNASTDELRLTVRSVNDAPSFALADTTLSVEDQDGPQSWTAWARDMAVGPPNESGQALTFLVSNNAATCFWSSLPWTPTARSPSPPWSARWVKRWSRSGSRTTEAPSWRAEHQCAQTFTLTVLPSNKAPWPRQPASRGWKTPCSTGP